MPASLTITLGALAGALGVALGAFGAHWLNQMLVEADQLDVYETAVRYQMYHAGALVLTGLLALRAPGTATQVAGISFVVGIVVFSGLLYALALLRGNGVEGVGFLGMIVPLGGLAFIVGWVALAWAAWGIGAAGD